MENEKKKTKSVSEAFQFVTIQSKRCRPMNQDMASPFSVPLVESQKSKWWRGGRSSRVSFKTGLFLLTLDVRR
jgi:hypothetical protein